MNTCSCLQLNPVFPDAFDPEKYNVVLHPDPDADPGHIRGFESEEKAYEATCRIKHLWLKIPTLKVPRIMSVMWARNNYILQSHGVDIVVTLEDGHEIPIQVKSSDRGAQRFERKHKFRRAKGWFTVLSKAVVVDPLEDIKFTIKKIANYLNEAYMAIVKRTNAITEHRKRQALRRQTNLPPRKKFRFMHKFQPNVHNGCACRC